MHIKEKPTNKGANSYRLKASENRELLYKKVVCLAVVISQFV